MTISDTRAVREILSNQIRILQAHSIQRLYLKCLAPNDNSKNQVYLSGSLDVLQLLPFGEVQRSDSSASKKELLKASVQLLWAINESEAEQAKGAQLILYPQYPEVRLSGFLKGCKAAPSDVMRVRDEGRLLLLGIASDERIYAMALSADAPESLAIRQLQLQHNVGALVDISEALDRRERELLFDALRRVHAKEWIQSWRLDAAGEAIPCKASQCVGYTLEAELGIIPNSDSDPDYDGWELKAITVPNLRSAASRAVTLMTPEPDGGWYKEKGVTSFLKTFGYADTKGLKGRINFSSPHRIGTQNKRTGLNLVLEGYDVQTPQKFSASGRLVLEGVDGRCAASWSFAKLLEHWRTKHQRAAYVPAEVRKASDASELSAFRYAKRIALGRGTSISRLLFALASGAVAYDPGIKLEVSKDGLESTKRRSQFRIPCKQLELLYESYEWVDLTKETAS